jgi:hypothetical protein
MVPVRTYHDAYTRVHEYGHTVLMCKKKEILIRIHYFHVLTDSVEHKFHIYSKNNLTKFHIILKRENYFLGNDHTNFKIVYGKLA